MFAHFSNRSGGLEGSAPRMNATHQPPHFHRAGLAVTDQRDVQCRLGMGRQFAWIDRKLESLCQTFLHENSFLELIKLNRLELTLFEVSNFVVMKLCNAVPSFNKLINKKARNGLPPDSTVNPASNLVLTWLVKSSLLCDVNMVASVSSPTLLVTALATVTSAGIQLFSPTFTELTRQMLDANNISSGESVHPVPLSLRNYPRKHGKG